MYNVYIITTSNDGLMENTKQIRMLEITKRVITFKNICEMLQYIYSKLTKKPKTKKLFSSSTFDISM